MIDVRSGRFHAIVSAYLSIAAGIIEAIFSLITGHAELSMSLYGIALMAVVDITGSALVLFIWQFSMSDSTVVTTRHKIQEARYSYIIGALMMLLGLFLVADSAKTLIQGKSPHETVEGEGSGIALFGTVLSLVLAAYKYKIGQELESCVINADAVSTLCSALTNMVALVVIFNSKFYWWLDGVAGLLVAFYTLHSGASTMTNSSHQLASYVSELDDDEIAYGKGISTTSIGGSSSNAAHRQQQSPGYLKLMNKYKYSYQNDVTPQQSRAKAYSGKPGGSSSSGGHKGRAGMIEIMNTRPTPYNFDNENRSQQSLFQNLYSQLTSSSSNGLFPSSTSHNSSGSSESRTAVAYNRIPASDSEEDEVTFSA